MTGLPLNSIDYPAITICSQGLIQDVINNAIKKQFSDYVKKTLNKDVDDLTQAEKEQIEQSYTQALFPGSESSITSMVNVLTSPGKEIYTYKTKLNPNKVYNEHRAN